MPFSFRFVSLITVLEPTFGVQFQAKCRIILSAFTSSPRRRADRHPTVSGSEEQKKKKRSHVFQGSTNYDSIYEVHFCDLSATPVTHARSSTCPCLIAANATTYIPIFHKTPKSSDGGLITAPPPKCGAASFRDRPPSAGRTRPESTSFRC